MSSVVVISTASVAYVIESLWVTEQSHNGRFQPFQWHARQIFSSFQTLAIDYEWQLSMRDEPPPQTPSLAGWWHWCHAIADGFHFRWLITFSYWLLIRHYRARDGAITELADRLLIFISRPPPLPMPIPPLAISAEITGCLATDIDIDIAIDTLCIE